MEENDIEFINSKKVMDSISEIMREDKDCYIRLLDKIQIKTNLSKKIIRDVLRNFIGHMM